METKRNVYMGGGDVDGVRDEERERGETQRIVDAEWGRERPGC